MRYTPVLLSGLLWLSGATCAAQENDVATYELGFSLNGTCFIYTVLNDSVTKSDAIGRKAFLMQASGAESSRANTEGADYFRTHGIGGCGAVTDTVTGETFFLCPTLDEVWKLMTGAASDGGGAFGWSANNFQPGEGQQRILAKYRSPTEKHWLGPYFGAQAFQLLHDMQDADWVARYRSAQ